MKNFIEDFSEKYNLPYDGYITPDAYTSLMEYRWEGNVRELQNFVERLFVLGYYDKAVTPEDVRFLLSNFPNRGRDPLTVNSTKSVSANIAEGASVVDLPVAQTYVHRHTPTGEEIRKALEASKGNKTKAAQMLGISRTHLWRLMQK